MVNFDFLCDEPCAVCGSAEHSFLSCDDPVLWKKARSKAARKRARFRGGPPESVSSRGTEARGGGSKKKEKLRERKREMGMGAEGEEVV